MKTKSFDAVEIKRRGAEALRRKLEGMTPEEELEFWRRRTEELRARQRLASPQAGAVQEQAR